MQKQFRNASDSQEQICGSGNCREISCHAIPGISFPCMQKVSSLLSSVADYLLNTDKAPDWILRYVVTGAVPFLQRYSLFHMLPEELLMKVFDIPNGKDVIINYSSVYHSLPNKALKIAQQRGWM